MRIKESKGSEFETSAFRKMTSGKVFDNFRQNAHIIK